MDNPQKLFDNLVKWKTQPEELVQDNANDQSNSDAIVDFTELMANKSPKQRDDATMDYIEQMRKLMISDNFLKAKKSLQNKVIKFVNETVESVALRQELDQQTAPPPPPPIPAPVQATMPPPMMVQPLPQGQPGMPPMPGQPPMGQPMPQGQPQPGSPIQGIMQQAPLGQIPPQQGPTPALNGQPQVNGSVGQLPPF
jgi:hypothetical protein